MFYCILPSLRCASVGVGRANTTEGEGLSANIEKNAAGASQMRVGIRIKVMDVHVQLANRMASGILIYREIAE